MQLALAVRRGGPRDGPSWRTKQVRGNTGCGEIKIWYNSEQECGFWFVPVQETTWKRYSVFIVTNHRYSPSPDSSPRYNTRPRKWSELTSGSDSGSRPIRLSWSIRDKALVRSVGLIDNPEFRVIALIATDSNPLASPEQSAASWAGGASR